jgi:BCD family chlorophyll transporter-like MFS transporter
VRSRRFPVNLFNRLMTVELAWPAILPGLLVALHYEYS